MDSATVAATAGPLRTSTLGQPPPRVRPSSPAAAIQLPARLRAPEISVRHRVYVSSVRFSFNLAISPLFAQHYPPVAELIGPEPSRETHLPSALLLDSSVRLFTKLSAISWGWYSRALQATPI